MITGAAFSLLAVAGTAALAARDPVAYIAVPDLLRAENVGTYLAENFTDAVRTAIAITALSHLAASLAAVVWFGKVGAVMRARFAFLKTGRLSVGHTVWFDLFKSIDKQAQRVALTIALDDGSMIEGFLKDYSVDAAVDDQVIALQGPIAVTDPSGRRRRTRAQFAAVPGGQVRTLLGMVEARPMELMR